MRSIISKYPGKAGSETIEEMLHATFLLLGMLIISSPKLVRAETPAPAASPSPVSWQLVSKTTEFELYRKESAGAAELFAFRGIGTLQATPTEVATGILDRVHRAEWMRDIRNLRTVRILAPGRFIEYSGVKTPWVVKNRDFVVQSEVTVDAAAKKITIVTRSVKDPDAPETEWIRGELTEGRFTIEPGARPGTSKLTADMDVDPKGTVPRWIVNHFQKKWPIIMFYSLRNFLGRRVAVLPEDLNPVLAGAKAF